MKIKIVNLRRFICSIVILLGIIVVLSLVLAKPTLSHGDVEYKKIYVSNGDTLWQIASEQSKENPYYENKDINSIIYNIKKINNLQNSNLSIGQELLIPTL